MSPKKTTSSQRFESAGRKAGRTFDQASTEIERDAQRLIAYINDELVPAVREHSSRGLRSAAKELANFADYLDRSKK